MPVLDEEQACFEKWITLIKADKISEVLAETAERSIAGDRALECLVYISQLAYKDAQNGIVFTSPRDDILKLTEVLGSIVVSRPSLCNLRFISSLYHIAFFFFKKNDLASLKTIYKIVVGAKKANSSTFLNDGTKVFESFVLLLKKVIPKLALNEDLPFEQSATKEFFSIFLSFLIVDNEVENGTTFLQTVLSASQFVSKQNKKSAVILISKCLKIFFQVKKIKDVDNSLSVIFKLFSSIFNYQLDMTGYASALGSVLSCIDTHKWKFGEEDVLHGGCFYLICQAKMFLSSKSEGEVKEMIQNANLFLEKIKHSKEKKDFVKEACLFLIYLVSSLKESKTIGSSVLFGACLNPFLEMMLNLYNALKDFNVDKYYFVHYLSSCFLIISEKGTAKKLVLKECLPAILKVENLIFELNQILRSENPEKGDYCTKLVLARCANLVRSYHLASLQEEVIAVSKPFCKFICTLPSSIFDDTPSKVSMEVSFTCLMQALGLQRLYELLEVAVAWLIVCPQSSDKVFRMWGDVKHNTICGGRSEYLDTTIFTIVTEGKSSLEERWLPCNLTTDQLGNLLVKELNTYFINTTLRGSPVLAAAKALESLATDDLTQARGVVVAHDVTSARSEFAEHCDHYNSRGKKLLAKLRKQKNQIDPVDFHCCMGDLLFTQFRFKLKTFRSQCEGEVLRLSALHESVGALVADLPEERPDPNDTCDVTARYTNLTLDKQQEVLAALHDAVSHWRTACTRLTENKELKTTKYDLRTTLKNLQEAALTMKLYCDEVKERELWHLLYNLAYLTGHGESLVIAAGERLKADCIDPDDMQKAEEFLNLPEVLEKTKRAFSLNKILFYLNKNKVARGLELLKVEIEGRKSLHPIQFIYCQVILGLYQKMSSWELCREEFLFSPSCHLSFHKGLSHLLYLIQQEKWSTLIEASQIQLNLLEVAYQLGEINWTLEQPREARCYLRSQLSVAQKLGLPLRTAQLFLLLAWVDLYTGMMDDCAVKLEGLEALLNLQGAPATDFDGLESPGKLSKGEVWSPEFLSHHAGCDCFVCRCVEYQRLVLETLTLRATYCANHNQPSLAAQSFKVAFQVHKQLSKSDDIKVQQSCSWMWKHYGDTLAQCNKPQEGLNVNKKSFESLSSPRNHPILSQHILHQKSCLLSMTKWHNKPVEPRIVIEIEESSTSAKTPVNKRGEILPLSSKTPLTVVSGNITPQHVRPVRKFTLPSSGEENTPPPKSSPKSRRRIQPPQKSRLETPLTNNKLPKTIKTPFTIVDDDGNAIGGASSKASSRLKKKTCIKTKDTADPIQKKLFSANEFSAEKKSDVLPIFKSPERKSNRKYKANTIEKTTLFKKPESLSRNLGNSKEEPRTESDTIFSFDELKLEVNKIKGTVPKSTYSRSSSKLVAKVENGVSSGKKPVTTDVDSDCSVVEGTPTPPERKHLIVRKMRPIRATRSNKT